MKRELVVTENRNTRNNLLRKTEKVPTGTYCYYIGNEYDYINMVYVDENNQDEISSLWNIKYFEDEATAIYNKYKVN